MTDKNEQKRINLRLKKQMHIVLANFDNIVFYGSPDMVLSNLRKFREYLSRQVEEPSYGV